MDKKQYMQKAFSKRRDGVILKNFVGVPVIVPFADWDYYYMYAPLMWAPASKNAEIDPITVTEGFVCDLTSIPRVFWSILPKAARYAAPAIVHDFLYWFQPVSRKLADEIFYIGMTELKVPKWKKLAIYNAVRMGGSHSWKKNLKLRENGEKRILKNYPPTVDITWNEWSENSLNFM